MRLYKACCAGSKKPSKCIVLERMACFMIAHMLRRRPRPGGSLGYAGMCVVCNTLFLSFLGVRTGCTSDHRLGPDEFEVPEAVSCCSNS